MKVTFSHTLRRVFSLCKSFVTKLMQTKRERERRKNERDESILHDFLGPIGDGSKHEVRNNFDAKQWVVSC